VLYASKCKNVIEEASQVRILVAKTGNDWGCDESAVPPLTAFVNSVVTTAAGAVRVEARGIRPVDVDGQFIVLTPYSDAGATTAMGAADYLMATNVRIAAWRCTFTGPAQFAPGTCR
jgi:hypothetical protein